MNQVCVLYCRLCNFKCNFLFACDVNHLSKKTNKPKALALRVKPCYVHVYAVSVYYRNTSVKGVFLHEPCNNISVVEN